MRERYRELGRWNKERTLEGGRRKEAEEGKGIPKIVAGDGSPMAIRAPRCDALFSKP
jgi:hypothetical protein